MNDFEMVSVAPIITGNTYVYTFHMRCIFVLMSLHSRFFTFLCPEIATSINTRVPFSLARIMTFIVRLDCVDLRLLIP